MGWSQFIIFFMLLLIFLINFHALFNSGILSSGGSDFNGMLKYELILNNYLLVNSIYGILFSVYLGSSIIGPDMQTGNIQIILTSFSSRAKYYIGTYLAVLLFMLTFQLLILLNVIALFLAFNVPFIGTEILICFIGTMLNETVILSITGIASIYMKGNQAAIVGVAGYAFFSLYTYNLIPFVNTSLAIDVTEYRNLLCNFLPITDIYPKSYTLPEIIELYSIQPIISNVYCYQFLYSILGIIIGTFCFQRREL